MEHTVVSNQVSIECLRQIDLLQFLFSRDEEYLLATVDWGQKLTLYQANGAKQVDID